jgi:predicted nuclease of predicted toxin-antitoxin system
VRVLLDENLPHDLAKVLAGHAVSTVQRLGWAGTKNGALLKRASGECDVFVTMDGNIEHQQSVSALSFGIVAIGAPSNRMADLLPVVPELLEAIDAVRPGEVRRVGTSPKGRGRPAQAPWLHARVLWERPRVTGRGPLVQSR